MFPQSVLGLKQDKTNPENVSLSTLANIKKIKNERFNGKSALYIASNHRKIELFFV
jgi:hypothetical protein